MSSTYSIGQDVFAKLCGGPTPTPVSSPGPEVLLHFHSDSEIAHSGFQINYHLVNASSDCGKEFEDPNGYIISPSGYSDSSSMCFYQISLKTNLKINITFSSLQMNDSPGCTTEYVALYSGRNTSSPLIARYCGSKIPPSFISDSDHVFIKLKRNGESAKFALSYQALCGGTFEGSSGVIQSEGYPESYTSDLTCGYLIKQPVGTTITLTILDLDFEDEDYYEDCYYDYLEIRDGDNANATLLESFCDNTEFVPIISSGNYLFLNFITDSSLHGKGFKAQYKTMKAGCGGLLTNKTGFISYGSDDKGYGIRQCRWMMQAPPGFVIQIFWTTFHIHSTYSCSIDNVNVYENNIYSNTSSLIGTYCGTRLPPVITTSSNVATINVLFKTMSTDQEFSAHYAFLNQTTVCGGNYFTTNGILKSPGYPQGYPPYSDCIWKITVPKGQQIILNATGFSLQPFGISCTHNYLEIRNGGSAHSPLIGKFCDLNKPKMIRSHTNQLYVHLSSRLYVTRTSRFMFTWTPTTGCGGIISAPEGTIASPNYPESYSRLSECFWKIIVNPGSVIRLVLLDVDLEKRKGDIKCLSDFVEIYDGPSELSKSLARICGEPHPQTLTSTGKQIDIYFRSDFSYEGRGFNIHYTGVCSNNLTGYGGVIESPNYPESYPLIQDCYWNITVPRKNRINITVSSFDLTESSFLSPFRPFKTAEVRNYLEIKYVSQDDEDNLKYISFGKYWNNTIPDSISIPSDRAILHFRSARNLIGAGFRLEWIIDGCGGHLRRAGNISSPNYPKKYPDGIECHWLIQAPIGYSIVISFTFVDVEKENDCSYDGISVFNGPDNNYPRLGLLCHIDKPVRYTSNGHLMNVRFISDYSYAGQGFLSNFTFIKSKCGGEMTAPSGVISSPNYPKNYNRGDNCEWLITIEENHVINFEFEDLDLSPTFSCLANYVKMYDGPTSDSPILAQVCNRTAPTQTYTSSTNQMLVRFSSSDYLTTLGFKAKYYKACGARIKATETSGNLRLHAFSLPVSERNQNCSWTIIAEAEQRVSLTITYLKMEDDYEESPFISVFDGESIKSPMIGEYRDSKLPPTIVSNGVALHVVANRDVNFFATYNVFGTSCGGTLNNLNGMFSTVDYPKSYPFNTACEWFIPLSPGNEVSLSFQNFNLPSSEKCNQDFLEIRQKSATGRLLGIFCGGNTPNNLTHQGSLWIYFKSGSIESGAVPTSAAKGFLAEYTMATDVQVKGYSGKIASPLYPQSFSSQEIFTWHINSRFRLARILVEFEDLYIESYDSQDCYSAYVTIFDGPDNESPILGTFCGFNIPARVESSSNSITIQASLNSKRLQSKFLLKWSQIHYPKKSNQSCGSDGIINLSQIHQYNFTSPGYPNGYGPRLICEWKFETDSRNSLRINFTDLSLQSVENSCFFDYVQIFSQNALVKIVCSRSHQYTLYNTSSVMRVVFTSNSFLNGPGFAAVVSEGCGGILERSSGVISFNENTPRDTKCKWSIKVKAGRMIEIKFLQFISIGNGECFSNILLKNGLDINSPNLGSGKYCNIPPLLQTTSNNLYIEFNGNPNNTKFEATYRDILYDCGGSLTISEEVPYILINSPNFPSKSERFIECFWVIRSPPGTYIRIDFDEIFALNPSKNCTTEAVELRDGGSLVSPLIDKFCTTSPSSQFSSDNIIFVKYFTEDKNPGHGFRANLSIGSCGGSYKGQSGEIKWEWDSKKKMPEPNCYWHIIAPSYAAITLNIKLKGITMNSYTCENNGKLSIYEIVTTPRYEENQLDDMCDGATQKKITSQTNRVVIKFIGVMKAYKYHGPASITISYSHGECHFTKTAAFGVIKSPGYPSLNYMRGSCSWTLTVPKGRRITLNITDFELENGLTTSGSMTQLLIFYDNSRFLLGKFFYNATKWVVKSSGNTLEIFFIYTHSTNQRGFSATYSSDEPAICDDIAGDYGSITRNTREESYSCTYIHQQSTKNRTLAFTIQSSLLYSSKHEDESYIEIEVSSAAVMGYGEYLYSTEKPSIYPVVVRTVFPNTFLEVGMRTMASNFTVDYMYYPCGGRLDNESGGISTPNYPNKYKKRLECAWLIKLSEEQQIKLNFHDFRLGDDCEQSFVMIYNGEYPTAPRIGKFCNTNKPDIIVSQKNSLFIEYHYQENSSAVGFNASYESLTKGCGGTYTTSTKVISSPNYPNDYPNNAECIWTIIAPEGSHVEFKPEGRFHVEETDGCKNDYIEVSDWKEEKWMSRGKWCGRTIQPTITSSENKMLVVFRSNDKITGNGFKANWNVKCGGHFRATRDKKYVISPGYPYNYDQDLICRYSIYSGETFLIKFEDFDLEGDYPSCINDNITITTSTFRRAHTEVYCGSVKPALLKGRFQMVITFRSDSWVSAKGFKFSIQTFECGESINVPRTLTISTSALISVGQDRVPGPYGTNSYLLNAENCLWNITAPKNKLITLKFANYSAMTGSCYFNTLEIHDGSKLKFDNLLANLCGRLDSQIPVLTTTNNSAVLYLKRFSVSQPTSFSVDISFTPGPAEGCGGTLELTNTKILRAPINLLNSDCQWKIVAPINNKIEFAFKNLKLPLGCDEARLHGKKNCTCSFIEMRDGTGPFSELIDQLCSNEVNFTQKFRTTRNLGFLRFYAYGNSTGSFEVSVKSIKDMCGPHVLNATNRIGILTSPRYPDGYDANINCLWTIRSNIYTQNLLLRFVDFDLTNETEHRTENKCSDDRVEIDEMDRNELYVGRRKKISSTSTPRYGSSSGHMISMNGQEILQLCGKESIPFEVYGRSINVGFVSTSKTGKGKGFKLEYSMAGCTSNYTQDYGKVMLQTLDTRCVIYITTTQNTTISLYFNLFWIPVRTNCSLGAMEIYDGHSESDPQLTKYCGYASPSSIFTSSNKMLVILSQTQREHSYSRIEATFMASTEGKGCGGKVFARSGVISSPMYPGKYSSDKICTWEINSPVGARLAVYFSRFDIAAACDENYLKITTFTNGKSNEKTFCRLDYPYTQYSDNKILITYKSSILNTGKGWFLSFKTRNSEIPFRPPLARPYLIRF